MAPAMHVPSDSDCEGAEPILMPAPAGGWRRKVLLGLAAAATLAGCLGVAFAHRASGTRPWDEGDELVELLSASAPDDASGGDGLAAALLVEDEGRFSGGAEEFLEGLLEDGAEEHDHEGAEDDVEDFAEGLQQKWAAGRQSGHHPQRKLWFVFRGADADGSGFVDGSELQGLSRALRARFGLSSEDYERLYAAAGRSEDGKMGFWELKHFAGVLFTFTHSDKDRDGVLSAQELEAGVPILRRTLAWAHVGHDTYERLFDEADEDDDGQLGPGELKELLAAIGDYWLPLPMARLFKLLDTDRSGFVDGHELRAQEALLLKRFRISPWQLKSLLEDAAGDSDAAKLDRRGFKHLLQAAWHGGPFRRVGPWTILGFFKHVDADQSLFVERPEFDRAVGMLRRVLGVPGPEGLKLIESADANKDHRLDPEEFGKMAWAARSRSPFAKMCPKAARIFKHIDLDHDLLLDTPELKKHWPKAMKVERFEQVVAAADTNVDSKLGPQEFAKLLATLHRLHPLRPGSGPPPKALRPASVQPVGRSLLRY